MAAPVARVRQVAQAVAEELSLADLGVAVTAVRVWNLALDLASLANTQVNVRAVEIETGWDDRGDDDDDQGVSCLWGVEVVVQKKITPSDVDAVDPLIDLAVAIHDHYDRGDVVSGAETCTLVDKEILLYDPVALSKSQFYSETKFVFLERLP